ncbi:METTL5 family protein [Vulcanisaeta distributa]|uniref:Methyltransferase small n=1 Tax=Vulcanisaeta distributa (strain DSM 14429 / JCM 11212 / NBRC 100878 / IC-017) TaxID=572478 RepID=E1QT10_VULDI|nr:METTL5 family protein [Vulcanisaeta distributa]ADN50877.1 methyltransferase small [Vulcanisaeta distributa DSM 14429]
MRMVRGADIRRLRDLELLIQGIPGYKSPKLNLEQYITDANIVAVAIWDAYMRNYLTNARVLDLGCGTGRFAIAAALMGARQVICVDIDPEALTIAKESASEYGLNNVDFVTNDVRNMAITGKFNVIFQNPPFGIQSERGLDVKFLTTAINHSNIIYTIHKLSTLDYINNKVNSLGCAMNVLDKVTITIPLMYKHHRKRKYKTEAFLARIECPGR